MASSTPPLRRTIKKPELRQMVPLADSTIWEMEQKGQFPRRFLLTPRCVVWDLAEIEAWLKLRRERPIPRAAAPNVRLRRSRPVRREDRAEGRPPAAP
jgi:prophage regulatory protein